MIDNNTIIEVCYIVGYDLENDIKTVKVKYSDKTVSARFLYPYLGTNYRHIWQPKIGTKALVFFPGNVSDNGIILGYLEKVDDEPILNFSDEGDKEVFQHENGTKVEFTNAEDQRQIKVITPKEEEINIDLDNQSLEIKNKEEQTRIFFDFKESKIELKSDELNIEASKNLTLKTPSLKIESSDTFEIQSGSFNLSATKSADISANSTINIKGQSVNLN